jgi:hypothetical protein
MKLIYVIDENYKDELLSQGFQLIQKTEIGGKTCWVLKSKNQFDFSLLDNSKCFCKNKMFL